MRTDSLISLIWALELVAEPSQETARVEFILSPTRKEILLGPAPSAPAA